VRDWKTAISPMVKSSQSRIPYDQLQQISQHLMQQQNGKYSTMRLQFNAIQINSAWPPNTADHYFFLAYSQRLQIGCLP